MQASYKIYTVRFFQKSEIWQADCDADLDGAADATLDLSSPAAFICNILTRFGWISTVPVLKYR